MNDLLSENHVKAFHRLRCPGCGLPTIEDRPGVTEEDALCSVCADQAEGNPVQEGYVEGPLPEA
jgi:formylmethanofuran dehydrogenase subunit E